MAVTLVSLTHGRTSDFRATSGMPARVAMRHVLNLLTGVLGGGYNGTAVETAQTQATGTLTLSTASGTVGGTINGVSVTVTASGGDTATAAALAAAINASANALVNQHVSATSALGVVTLMADYPGPAGNAVTLAASGTGVTASGARLTGGVSTTYTF